jgi:division/cell wall cluster transcriptional repressor MraZ
MASLDYFERDLDDKNRLTIPAGIRSEFKVGEVVITRGFRRYLHLYSKQVWEKQMEAALRGDILDERVADLNVKFRSGKSTAKMDTKQGRIILEQHLLDYAGITKKVVAVRAGDYWRISAPSQT